MAITSGTAINLPVNLEIMQGSLNDLQKVLNKLEPDSAPFKSLSRIILEMTRGMEKFQVQTSKGFTSQRQFDQAQKTVEKLEESLTRAQLTISRIKFSDIKLDTKQSAAFDGFEKELDNIEKKLNAVKEKVKNDIFSDDVTKSQLSLIDKQGLNKSFDEIEKIVERRTQTIKAEIDGYKAQLSLLDERVAKGTRAQSLLNQGITNDIFGGQYTYEKNGSTYFKPGEAKAKFLNALQEEFSLTNEDKDRLKNLTLGQMSDLFKQMGQGGVPNIFEQWTKSLGDDSGAQQKLKDKIQKAEELQNAVLNLQQKLTAAQGDGTPLSLAMTQYNDDVKRVAAAITEYEGAVLNGVRANDQYKNSFNSMSGQLNSFTTQLNNANAEFLRLQQQQQTFNSIKTTIVNFMGFNQVLNLTKTAIREAMNHIKELDTTMNGIAIVTDMTTADLWNQIDAYSEMAQRYGTTIQGAYEVSKIYYQAGYETNDVLTLMNETLKLSKISGLDYATTTDYMMTATRGFHMEVSEAANVVDVYSALAANTAVSQQELAEAMSKTASSMENVGSTFEETSSMIATMVAVTRESANNIGSAMKSIASRYGELTKNPTKLLDAEGEAMSFNKVDEALKSVGITLQTTDHQFRSFTDVILELTEVWDKLDSAQQRYIATQFAGNRQQSRFLALVSNKDLLQANLRVAEESEDTGTLQALKALDSIESKLNQVQVAYQQFYTNLGVESVWKTLLDGTKNFINSLNSLPKAFGKIPLGAATVVADAISVIKDIGLRGISLVAKDFLNNMKTSINPAEVESTGKELGEAFTKGLKDGSLNNATLKQLQDEIVKQFNNKDVLYTFADNLNNSLKKAQESGDFSGITANVQNVINELEKLGTVSEKDLESLRQMAGAGDAADFNAIINKLREMGGAAEEFAQKLQQTAAIKVSNNLTGIGAALNVVANAMDKSSSAGRVFAGVIMSAGGALKAFGEINKYIATGGAFPWLAVAMAAITVVNGLATAIETDTEKLERLQKQAEELSNTAKQIKADEKTLQSGINKIEELKVKRLENAEATNEYQAAVEDLAEKFPELILGFDEAGNTILDLESAEDALAEARKKTLQATYDAAVAESEAKQQEVKNAKEQVKQLRYNYEEETLAGLNANQNSTNSSIISSLANSLNSLGYRGEFSSMLTEYGNELLSGKLLPEDIISSSGILTTIRGALSRIYEAAGIEGIDESFEIKNYSDFKKAFEDVEGLDESFKNLIEYLDQINEGIDENIQSDLEIVTSFAARLEEIDFGSEEGREEYNRFKEAYSKLDETTKKDLNDRIFNVEELSKNIEQIVSFSNQSKGINNSLISSYLQLTKVNEKGWEFLEENNQARLLLTNQLTETWMNSDEYKNKTWKEFKSSDDFENAVNEFYEAYNQLGKDKQKLLEEIETDNRSYTAQDVKRMLGIEDDENNPINKYIDSLYKTAEESKKQVDEIFKDYNKVQWNSKKLKFDLTPISQLQNGLSKIQENLDFPPEIISFINARAKEINQLTKDGFVQSAQRLSDQTLTFLSTLYSESMEPQERATIMAILNSANLQTKEGIDEAIEQIQNSNVDDADQKAVIEQLETRKKELVDNVALSIQADLAQLVEEAEDDSKLLSKATSGLSVKETNELIQQAQSWDVNLSLKDFIPNGDKLIASENAFNEMQQGYQSKLKAAGDKAQENLDKAKSLNLYDGNNFSIPELLTEDQLKFFEQQLGGFSTDMTNFVDGDTTRLSKVGREKVEEIYKTISDSLFEYGESIGILFQTIFGEANWNKGDYSSLINGKRFSSGNRVTQTGNQVPVIEQIFDADEFNKYLTGESKYDAQTDPNLKTAVEKARDGVSTFLSDLLSKGADQFNASDYAEAGIEKETFNQMSADALAVKNGKLSYAEFVNKYADLTGDSIEAINNLIIQAIQQDNKTSEAAQRKAFSDLTIVGDTITGTEEQINALATALGTGVETLLGEQKADGTYVLITEGIQDILKNLGIIKQSIPNQLKTFSDNLSKAADYITKGSNDTAAMQQFADEYAKALGGEAGDYSWEQLFNWDSYAEVYTLSADAYFTYIEAQKQKLNEAGAADEEVARILNDARKQLASNVDIAKYLKSDRREKATNDLKAQLVSYYESIAREETQNLPDYAKKAALNSVELRAQQTIAALNEGGAAAVEAYREIIKKQENRDLTAEEVKEAYLSELNQYKDALSELNSGIQVNSIVTNDFLRKALKDADFEIDKNGVVTVVGNMIDAYHNIYDGMKDSGEATVSELNEAYAKILEIEDDSDVISALGDAASMTYTRLGEILASKGIKLTDELLAQYSDTIQSIGGGKVRITNFDRFATEIMQWTDIDKNSEEYVSAFKTYNDSLIDMNRKAERNILEEVQALENAKAGDWINLTQLMSKTDLSMSKLFEKRYFSDFNYTGNVDISKRPIISPEKMKAAGYTDFDGDYATLYSTTFSFGDAIKDLSDCLDIVATPIQDLNTVLSDKELATYIEDLVNSTDGSVEAILAADAAQKNLILGMFEGEEILSEANREYGEKLHEFSEDWVNSNPVEELQNELQNALSKYGASLEDGILKFSDNANIPAVMGTLTNYLQEYGNLSVQEEAELLDTLNANLKSYSDAISNAIKGTATNIEIQKISDWAESLNIQIDFTKTIDGLKISQDSAIKLYNELKKIDYLQSQLVFKELSDSLKENNSNYKDMSSILARIKTLEEEINNPNVSTARREEYKRELELAKEIKETRALTDPDSFNFMSNDIPDAMKGAENYWNSWGNAFKAMNEAGESGYMGITDFYNIVNEMNNLAKMSGNTLTFMGKELSGDAEDAANLIQLGMSHLANVDGSGVSVALKEFGAGFAKSAAGMQTGVKDGIKAVAESQIEMLDAQIQLLETIIAMEALGQIDTNGNGVFDFIKEELGELDDDGFIEKFGQGYKKAISDLKKYFEDPNASEDIKNAYKNVKIMGHSIEELFNASEEDLKNWGIKGETLQKLLQGLYELSQSDDFDPSNITQMIQQMLVEQGIDGEIVVDTGEQKITINDKTVYSFNWNDENVQNALKVFGKDTEKHRKDFEQALKNYENGNANLKELEVVLTYKGVIKADIKNPDYVEINGKKVKKNGKNFQAELGRAALEDKFPEFKESKITVNKEGTVSVYGTVQVGNQEIKVKSKNGTTKCYSQKLNKWFSSLEELQNAEVDEIIRVATEAQKQGAPIEIPTREQVMYQRFGITTNTETTFKDSEGNEIKNPENNISFKRAVQDFVSKSESAMDAYLKDPNNLTPTGDGRYTLTLIDGSQIEFKASGQKEAEAKAKEEAAKFADPLANSVAAGIIAAFANDPKNTIGNALIEAITTALTRVSFDGQNFTISDIPVTAEKITVDTSKATPISGPITKETGDKAKAFVESKKSSLTVPNVPVTVEKATYSAPTETDASALIDAATTTGKDVNAGLADGMSDTTEITEKARGNINSIIGTMNTAAGVQMAGSGSTKTSQTGKDLIAGLIAGLSDEASRTDAVSQATSLAEQIINAIQSYFNDNPLSLSAGISTPETPTSKPQKTESKKTVAPTPQITSPTIDLSSLQTAINAISIAGKNAAAQLGQLNANLINSKVKAENFEDALSKIGDNGKTKAEDFEKALSDIGDNGKNKANDFSAALDAIKQDGINRTNDFKDAVNAIEANGVNNARAFKDAVNNTESSGASNAKAYKEAVNDTGSSGANNASAYRYAVNGTTREGAEHAEAFKRAISNIGGTVSLGVNVSVNVQGGAGAKGTIGSWSVSNGGGKRTSDTTLEWNQHHAYAAGKDTLMGELGPELVVSHGRYFLVGQNGPEMVNLDSDAIVFNHLQTKKLIEKGKISSHGTPVTNERKATSMATGNFEGTALASASEVLTILKQLREMWKSLLNASLKNLGIAAGKEKDKNKNTGKDSTPTDKIAKDAEATVKYTAGVSTNVERWYNWLQAIEATQYKINKLTKEYNLLEKDGASVEEKLANLRQQQKAREENKATRERLVKEQTAYRTDYIREANQGLMSAFYQADEKTGQVYLANDDAFQRYLKEQARKGNEVGLLGSVLAKGKTIKKGQKLQRGYTVSERENIAARIVKSEYNSQSSIPYYLQKYYDNGKLIEGQEDAAKKAVVEYYGDKNKYNKTFRLTRDIKSGMDFLAELNAQDDAGELVHSGAEQLAMIDEMGFLTPDLLANIDQTQEGWEAEVVQRFFDKIEEDKTQIEALDESIRDQETAALEDAAAIQEINNQIREIVKPIAGVTDGLEKWYNELKKIEAIQQELNKLSKENDILQKERLINGQNIYDNLKQQEAALREQKKQNEDLAKKRREAAEELAEKYSDLPINIDSQTGQATFSEDIFRPGLGKVKTSYRDTKKISYNGKEYEVDVNGNFVDENGTLRNSETKEKAEGEFGTLDTTVTKGHIYDFTNKSIVDFIKDLTQQDETGNVKFNAEEQYQLMKSAGLERFMQYDENGNKIYDDFGALSKEEMEKAVAAGIKRLQNSVNSINEENNAAISLDQENLDIQSKILDLQQSLIDNQIEVENMVKNAVEQQHQDAIDSKKDLKDALDEASSKTLEGLRESLDQEKAIYDKAQDKEELATLQRQLEVAQRTGASMSKIQGLQDQIASKQKDMYFTEREELIDNIENSMNREIEALDTQISIMEATLEYQKENGLLWGEINNILANTPAAIINYIKEHTPEQLSNSETQRTEELLKIGKKVEEFVSYRDDSDKAENETTVEISSGSGKKDENKEEGKTEEKDSSDIEEYEVEDEEKSEEREENDDDNWDPTIDEIEVENAEVQDDPSLKFDDPNLYVNQDLGELVEGGLLEDDLWNKNKNKKYNASKGEYGILGVIQKATKLGKIKNLSNNDVTEALSSRYKQAIANGASEAQIAKTWNSWSDNQLKKVLEAELKKKGKIVKFKNGGEIDFTGPAWVDGSRSEPEQIFNFSQMNALREHLLNGVDVTRQAVSGLSDIMNQLPNINTYNNINSALDSGVSIGTLEFHMEVSEIASDYDARRAGEQAMNEIVRIARKTGTRSLSRR